MNLGVSGWVVAAVVVILAGCATSPPSTFYTLTAMREMPGLGGPSRAGLGVGLGPVQFPQFLDRPEVVTRDAGNRLAIDDFHRWGGTLQDDFLRVWAENVSSLLESTTVFVVPSDVRYPLDFRVTANVLAFEGTFDGAAVLRARWAVLDHQTDEVLRVEETAYRRPLAEPRDEGALIAAMSAVLGDFSRDVAATLQRLPKPRRPQPTTAPERLDRLP
jgi:uncharacterized protein